jgi:hypothetical protein
VQDATVKFLVDGGNVGTSTSNSTGYATFSFTLSTGTHKWHATAETTGYVSGKSSTWSFTYSPSLPSYIQVPASTLSPPLEVPRAVRDHRPEAKATAVLCVA